MAQPLTQLSAIGTPEPYHAITPKLTVPFLRVAVVHVVPASEVVMIEVPAEDFDVAVPVPVFETITVPAEDPTVIVPAE